VPKYYPNVTVLFADFKNFTGISAKLTPEQLVNEIDYYFQNLDLLMEKYGIEKIKTIGDAYMCVSGLNSDAGTHAKTMIRLALDIQKFMEEDKASRKKEKRQIWELRIGINSGSVVGGVVGSKKFAFDIWGDTVNVASRMESNGEVGKVNISQDVYLQIKDEFLCTHRGRIPIKNKDEVDMYFVEKVVS
jgi:class 3 adenylate cyclase